MGPLRKWDEINPLGPMLRALCLENAAYCDDHFHYLPNSVDDATNVKEIVNTVPSSEAELETNLKDKKAMQAALAGFFGRATARPLQVWLFYFSGHGVKQGDQLYLVPTGASHSDCERLEEQRLLHGEIFCTFKDWLRKVNITDVICAVVIDACRSQVDGSECTDPFPEALEPRGNGLPEVWAMCVATARSKAAYTSPPAVSDLSALTHHFISEECGVFEPNVPFKRALELVCERGRLSNTHKKQDPTILGLEKIPELFCLWPEYSVAQQFDVCLCYNEEVDKPLAKFIGDQLLLSGKCSQGIFLKLKLAGRIETRNLQVLCTTAILSHSSSQITPWMAFWPSPTMFHAKATRQGS